MSFAASVALALSVALMPTSATSTPMHGVLPQAQTVEEYVETYFADIPVMIAVAQCESHFKQFDADGSVHRGRVNNKDVGVMQINEFYHSKTATSLGIDLYTVEGNLAYARNLYEREGTKPWSSSSPCWGKKVQHLAKK
jgi:hypothetical protein